MCCGAEEEDDEDEDEGPCCGSVSLPMTVPRVRSLR